MKLKKNDVCMYVDEEANYQELLGKIVVVIGEYQHSKSQLLLAHHNDKKHIEYLYPEELVKIGEL